MHPLLQCVTGLSMNFLTQTLIAMIYLLSFSFLFLACPLFFFIIIIKDRGYTL